MGRFGLSKHCKLYFLSFFVIFLLIFFCRENIDIVVNAFRDKKNQNPLHLDFFEKRFRMFYKFCYQKVLTELERI